MEADGEFQLVCTVTAGSRILGYVVIDLFVRGRSCGGLRSSRTSTRQRRADGSRHDAEVRVPRPRSGWRKGRCPGCLRRPLGAAVPRRVRAGHRPVAPGPDLRARDGHGDRQRRHRLAPRRRWATARAARATRHAVGVLYRAQRGPVGPRGGQAHRPRGLSACRVAIEGLGRVGSPLATLLRAAGARVVAVSTSRGAIYDPEGLDVERLVALGTQQGSRVVEAYPGAARLDRAALLELPVDILCPAARHDSVHADNADQIAARIICPGANNPVTPAAEDRLVARGVLCLPDFVTNSGGVLGGTMEFASMDRMRIASFMARHLAPRIADVLDEAARRRVAPRQVAAELALRRSRAIRQRAARPSWLGRLFEAGLESYSRGWVPSAVVSALSPMYFRRILA